MLGKIEIEHTEKRFWDDRGETTIVAERGPIDFLEYLEFKEAGDVRGGHYHERYTESFYVISGCVRLTALDVASGVIEEFQLGAGDLVTIPGLVAHRFVAQEACRALAFGTGSSPLEDRTTVESAAWDPGPTPKRASA